jgi:hypothetical protein
MGNTQPVFGPFDLSLAELTYRGLDGVYAIFARVGNYSIPIDVGESGDIGTRLRTHDRKRDWVSLLRSGLPVTFEVYATPTPLENLGHAKSYRTWIEWLWRWQYKAQGFWLFGDRP